MLLAWRARLGTACLLLGSQCVREQCLLQINPQEMAVLETVKAPRLPVFWGTAGAQPLTVVLHVCVCCREASGKGKHLSAGCPPLTPALLSQPPNQTLFLWLASQKHPGTHHQTSCVIKTHYLCGSSQAARPCHFSREPGKLKHISLWFPAQALVSKVTVTTHPLPLPFRARHFPPACL